MIYLLGYDADEVAKLRKDMASEPNYTIAVLSWDYGLCLRELVPADACIVYVKQDAGVPQTLLGDLLTTYRRTMARRRCAFACPFLPDARKIRDDIAKSAQALSNLEPFVPAVDVVEFVSTSAAALSNAVLSLQLQYDQPGGPVFWPHVALPEEPEIHVIGKLPRYFVMPTQPLDDVQNSTVKLVFGPNNLLQFQQAGTLNFKPLILPLPAQELPYYVKYITETVAPVPFPARRILAADAWIASRGVGDVDNTIYRHDMAVVDAQEYEKRQKTFQQTNREKTLCVIVVSDNAFITAELPFMAPELVVRHAYELDVAVGMETYGLPVLFLHSPGAFRQDITDRYAEVNGTFAHRFMFLPEDIARIGRILDRAKKELAYAKGIRNFPLRTVSWITYATQPRVLSQFEDFVALQRPSIVFQLYGMKTMCFVKHIFVTWKTPPVFGPCVVDDTGSAEGTTEQLAKLRHFNHSIYLLKELTLPDIDSGYQKIAMSPTRGLRLLDFVLIVYGQATSGSEISAAEKLAQRSRAYDASPILAYIQQYDISKSLNQLQEIANRRARSTKLYLVGLDRSLTPQTTDGPLKRWWSNVVRIMPEKNESFSAIVRKILTDEDGALQAVLNSQFQATSLHNKFRQMPVAQPRVQMLD